LTRLRTLFGWAAAKDLVDADPTAGVRTRVNEKSRVRALVTVDGEGDINGEEIERFWFGCEGLGWPFGPLFKLLLLTGQRREEVGGMRWSELNLEKRIWTIPAERAKSDRVHIVHLSDLAIEVIESIPRTGDLVFSSTGSTPVSGYSRAKERIDSLMTKQVRERTGNPDARIADWILHDLRRTAATGMAGLEIAPHVVDKILNHSAIIRGIALIYNKHEYEKERRAALEAWGRYIEALVRDVPSNVADIAEARARR
jgi:integrase